jgi:hypothetical protein
MCKGCHIVKLQSDVQFCITCRCAPMETLCHHLETMESGLDMLLDELETLDLISGLTELNDLVKV